MHQLKYPIEVTRTEKNEYCIKVIDYPQCTHIADDYDIAYEKTREQLEDITWQDTYKKKLLQPSQLAEIIKSNSRNTFHTYIKIANRYNDLPEILYYYLPVSEILFKMVTDPYIWFSELKNFNDPFEFPEVFNKVWTPGEEWKEFEYAFGMFKDKWHLFKNYSSAQEAFLHLRATATKTLDEILNLKISTLEETMKKSRVACFSRNFNNVLMWSHYSNKHSGVVLGYNCNDLLDKKEKIVGSDIDYRIKKRKLDAGNYAGPIEKTLESDYTAIKLFTKHPSWSYEEEFRLLSHNDKNGEHSISKNSIKEIYFGCKMDISTKKSLLALLKGLNLKIDIYEMIKEDNFKLQRKILEVQKTRTLY